MRTSKTVAHYRLWFRRKHLSLSLSLSTEECTRMKDKKRVAQANVFSLSYTVWLRRSLQPNGDLQQDHGLFFNVFRHFFFFTNPVGYAKSLQRKKKRTGSVFQTMWLTNDTPSSLCWVRSFFFLFFYFFYIFLLPNDDRVEQLQVATKVWLFLVHDLSSQAKNIFNFVHPKC